MPVSRSFGGSVPQTGVLKKWVVTPKMSGWCVGFPKGVFFCGVVLGVLFCLTGCKTTDTQCQRISRQQALTIEGLNSEISDSIRKLIQRLVPGRHWKKFKPR